MTVAAANPADPLCLSDDEIRQLQRFVELVLRWNPKINLISRASAADVWDRHVVDSAQVFLQMPEVCESWIDLGSGGGFPGIIVAILASHRKPGLRVTLVESDQRKAVFLRQAVRELGLTCTVFAKRIEDLSGLTADVVSARALASLDKLLEMSAPLLAAGGGCLFSKGANRAQELVEAGRNWGFTVTEHPSLTEPTAAILKITDLRHV